MQFWQRIALVAVLSSAAAFGQNADAINRTPPVIFEQSLAPLLTPIAEVLTGRDAFPDDKTGGVVLLAESIRYRDTSGINYRLLHSVCLATTQAGIDPMSSDTFSYDRERESIFLIDAATLHPDGSRQPIEGKGAFIQTPQHEAANSLYTSQSELRIVYPKIAPGAITEVVVLIRENTPVMPGQFATTRTFGSGWPVFLNRFVVDLPSSDWSRVSSAGTAAGVPEPVCEESGPGRERRTWVQRLAPATHWEYYAPTYAFRAPTLWLTTLRSWDDLAKWYQVQVATSSTVGPELAAAVDRAVAGITDRATIIERLHALAANEVRYTGLEFGLAGYCPHACDEVWEKRYGDCKDKSTLLRAMLDRKGIRSHIVLLDTRGNGQIEKASPSWQQFNHAILAVENDDGYLFCDPTGKHLAPGTLGLGDLARDVLVLREDRAEWVRTPDLLDAATRIGAELTLSPEGELSGWFSFGAEGSDAAFYADYFNGLDQQDLRKKMQDYAGAFFAGAEVVDVDYQPVVGATRNLSCRAYLVRPARATNGASLNFPYPAGWVPPVDNVGERRFPYFAARRNTSVDVSITMAAGWRVISLPEVFTAPSPVAHFKGAWRQEGNRLTAHLSYRPERAELTAAEFRVFQRSVRALLAWLEQSAVLATSVSDAAVATPPLAATQKELSDFPVLPSGEGQLRLLEERFPEASGKDEQRQLALGKVLQWFPQDPDIVFQARVHLADPALSKTSERVFADTLAQLLKQHGKNLSTTIRTWGEYREASARWASTKNPAALAKLQALARDEKLSTFRRGWSAHAAGFALLPNKPREAAAFLRPFTEFESDALPRIVELTARALARADDTAAFEDWISRLATRQGAKADLLLASTIKALMGDRANIPVSTVPKITTILARVIRDATSYPQAHPELCTLRDTLAAEEAQSRFTTELGRWLHKHPPVWWTKEKAKAYANGEAVVARIESENKKPDANAVLDAICQLLLHHRPDYPTFAKYCNWALWYLETRKLNDPMLDRFSRLALELPAAPSEEIVEAWMVRASFLRRTNDLAGARSLYARMLDGSDAKEYQKVEIGGELGLLELAAKRPDQALAAWQRISPIHTKHKRGIDYLYAALLVHLERGEFDRGIEIVTQIARQEKKYLDESANAIPIAALLRAANDPIALNRYWRHAHTWRKQWRTFLSSTGVSPTPSETLPIAVDWGANNELCQKAATARDLPAYLHLLDSEVRIACAVPLVGGNFVGHAIKSDFMPPAQRRQFYECVIVLLAGMDLVDPIYDDTAKLWEAALLADVGRPADATNKARTLHQKLGSAAPLGQAALRVWLISAQAEADREAAIAHALELLSSDTATPERLITVASLSDTLAKTKDTSVHIALLERETARPDFARTTESGRALLARLGQLRSEGASTTGFTKMVQSWSAAPEREWLQRIPLTSLANPRLANLREAMIVPTNGFTEAERLKFNLLLSLDERCDIQSREKAFRDVVWEVALATNDYEAFTGQILDTVSGSGLSQDSRGYLLRLAIWHLAIDRRPELLAKCTAHPLFAGMADTYKQSIGATTKALQLLAGTGANRRTEAFAALTEQPLDGLRNILARQVLQALALGGESETTDKLLAGAESLVVDPSLDQSVAAIRLNWTRAVRTAHELAPLVARLQQLVYSIPEANAQCSPRANNLIDLSSRASLTRDEQIALVTERLRRLDGVGAELGELLEMLRASQWLGRTQGAELFEFFVTLPINDAAKSALVFPTALLSDNDDPEIRERVEKGVQVLCTPTATAAQPQVATAACMVRAILTLRSNQTERPDILFDPQQTRGISPQFLNMLQLQFYVSRGQTSFFESILETVDPSLISEYGLIQFIQPALQRTGRQAEQKLYEQAARESLVRKLGDTWFKPQANRSWGAVLALAETEGLGELVPDAWFDHVAATARNEANRAELEVSRAHIRRDWPKLKEAADKLLHLVPSMYDVYLLRAHAERALGMSQAARTDLDVFLQYCLGSAHYQEALQMRKELTEPAVSVASGTLP